MHKCLYEANIEFIFNLLQKMCNKGHTLLQVLKLFFKFANFLAILNTKYQI
jgi:hypothetical protein